MAVAQLKDGRWTCYYRTPVDPVTGKTRIKKEYFGRGLDAEAAARARDESLNLRKRRPVRVHSGPTFGECAATYMLNRNLAGTTKGVYWYILNSTIMPALGHRDALGLTHHDMDRYVANRRKAKVKDSTISREMTAITAILNFAVSRRPPLIPRNPIRDYKKPKEQNAHIIPPTSEEISRILQHAPDHLRRAILLSYYLGLRPGAVELLSLTWDRINWETGTILVISAHKGGPEKRSVPIHKTFQPILATWHAQDRKSKTGPIVHYNKKAIASIKVTWRNTLRRAKIKRPLRPYDVRHYFVTTALESGADIKALSEIVGSRPQTLMRHYQHVSTRLQRETVAKIPPMDIPAGDTKYPQKRKAGTKTRSGLKS